MPVNRSHGRILRFAGLSRSGNHAIIDWILAHMRGDWLFLNCVEPNADPLATARPLQRGRRHRSSRPGQGLPKTADGLGAWDCLSFSFEDAFLGVALGRQASMVQEASVGGAPDGADVLILRDPFNLLASRRRLGCATVTEGGAIRIWKQHARAFLAGRFPGARRLTPVSYNAWVREPSYRRLLAERLGLRFTDAGVDRVPACAGGSSFDGRNFCGSARRMALFDRWRWCAEDAGYWRLFDAETVRLARRIFGDLAPMDEPLATAARRLGGEARRLAA